MACMSYSAKLHAPVVPPLYRKQLKWTTLQWHWHNFMLTQVNRCMLWIALRSNFVSTQQTRGAKNIHHDPKGMQWPNSVMGVLYLKLPIAIIGSPQMHALGAILDPLEPSCSLGPSLSTSASFRFFVLKLPLFCPLPLFFYPWKCVSFLHATFSSLFVWLFS